MSDRKSVQTALLHPDYTPPPGFAAYPTAIHYASTVLFKDVASMRTRDWRDKNCYTYGLHGTPTSFTLEARLAEIEGGAHCELAPSGLAAIAMVDFALLKSGDDMLLPDNVYSPSRELGRWLEQDYGITTRYYDPLVGAGIDALIRPNTKLVWTEAPGSVSMEVPDIPAIAAAVRARRAQGQDIVSAIDNTWSAGLAFHPFEHGIDISMQALTKYQSGGSDVLMGAVITRDEALMHKIKLAHMRIGFGVSMNDVFLVLRGLESMKLRFDAHDASARKIAAWLKTRPEIAQVLHPALPDCPGHDIWQRDFSGAGGLFSVIFDPRYTEAQIDRFIESLELFGIGFSWGGSHSLCVPYRIKNMRSGWKQAGELVRFSIGLEDSDDLIADIERAFVTL